MLTQRLRTHIPLSAFYLGILSLGASAETVSCGDTQVSISYDQVEHAELACDAVEQAKAIFENCNVQPVSRPINIDIVGDLKEGCVGVYHCHQDLIEVLSPPLIQERRDLEGAFADLNPDEYFKSVVVHELTHASNDDMPCPFEACVATDEYIAYSMQIMSLSEQGRTEFEDRSQIERRISSDELSPIILFMAPDLFAQKVWAHLSQRDDACHYIRQLVDGQILLDQGRF